MRVRVRGKNPSSGSMLKTHRATFSRKGRRKLLDSIPIIE